MNIAINRAVPTARNLTKLYQGSALTMVGYMPEELPLYIEVLQPFIKGDSVVVYETTGGVIAKEFDVKLPKDLNVFMIDLNNLKDINKLAVTVRFEYGFRWFDDVIGNLIPDEVEYEESTS